MYATSYTKIHHESKICQLSQLRFLLIVYKFPLNFFFLESFAIVQIIAS